MEISPFLDLGNRKCHILRPTILKTATRKTPRTTKNRFAFRALADRFAKNVKCTIAIISRVINTAIQDSIVVMCMMVSARRSGWSQYSRFGMLMTVAGSLEIEKPMLRKNNGSPTCNEHKRIVALVLDIQSFGLPSIPKWVATRSGSCVQYHA